MHQFLEGKFRKQSTHTAATLVKNCFACREAANKRAMHGSVQHLTFLAPPCVQIGVEFGTKIISLGNRQIKLQPPPQFC